MKNILKRTISFLLAANMALSCAVPALAFELEKIGEEISFSEAETVETAENPWEGKSAVFVGDSITAGSGTTKKYYEYLNEALGFGSVTGMGVGGSCFSLYSDYGTKNQPLMSRYQNIPSADLIVVFMGTNDYGHETPLGTIDDTEDGTFYGALNVIIPALVAKHTASKIVFATPIHRYGAGTSGILGTKFTYDNIPNGVGATLEDYADAIKEVCEENGVTVIDLFTECTLDPSIEEVRTEYMPDGIHPNAAGHEVLAEIMEEHIRGYEPVEVDPEDLTEIIHGNKFAALGDANRASSRINYYLKAGTVITLNDPETFQWACAKTDGENSSKNLGYFPEKQWTDIATATVEADGWIGFTFKYRDETKAFDLSRPLSDFITIEEPEIEDPNALRGKTLSILGASISTYAGTSNGAAADTTNSTIRNNAKYYPNNTVKDVALGDTWWMQFADDLGLRLLVNNSWSGGAILLERAGTVGAYVDRCVQLHDNTGENAGEDPDIIIIQKGFNDFSYGKSTLGTAEDINYEELILEDGYAEPKTTMEATVIMLDKMTKRYPDAEIYMFSHFKRVKQSAADTELMEKLNSSIETVCERYGIKVIDLYSVLGSVEFVGDGSLHPNRLGMDIMTEAAKRTVLANTAYETETHLVSFELEGVSADYGDDKIVISGDSFSVNLSAEIAGILEVSVTMGGKDITETAYKDGKVSIESVTGDVVIKAESVHEPKEYRWESDGTDLVCISGENGLTKISGTTTGGVFSKTAYSLEEPVVLLHNKTWTVEWKCEGTFMNENGSTGARIFTSDNINANYNARYIFKSATKWLIAMGEKDSSGSHNYGIALEDHGIDGSALHTYRLENRIASDGSNMVYLFVDGMEIGALNNYYVGTTDKGTTSDWLSGKDFVFPYMGTDTHGFSNAKIDYIAVWENGEETEPLSLRYDDRYDVSGKTVEIVDAGKPTSYKVGYGVAEGTLDDAVITLSGEKLIATGIGTAKVRIDGTLYEITVEASPISLFMITGHSMGAGQNGSRTESVVGPDGQVYSSHGTTNLSASTEGTGISFAAQTKANGINAFTEEGEGTIGEGSAFAWKWNKLTGEKVWVLNTAVGGSNLKEWIPGATNYKNAVNQYKRAQEILSNEIKAGHYVLSDMGIFYHNGANFSYKGVTFTQADLKNWYDSMWGGFKSELAKDMDGNGKTESVSFLGIVPIWTKSGGQSYTQDEPAAMFMAASAEYDDIFTVSVIGKEWLTDADVSAFFPEIDYEIQSGAVLKRPVKSSEVFASDNVHYKQVGYNAVGIDIAENLYEYLKGENELSEVKLVYPETLGEIEDNTELVYGEELIIVPIVEPITYSGLEFASEGIVEISYPLAIKATGNGTGKLIVSSGGKVIKELNFVCSSKPEALSLRYDDRYDVSGKTVEIVDAGKPTSYKVGYGVAEGTFDDAVITLDGEKLIATGIGTAKVRIDGVLYEITVEAAPISLLLLIGQSNMRGSEGNANQSIICPEGVVYATYGDDRGADNT
ncbi:MAG: SGNH/GDSL hydrolase family protein, partial [Oscillospiraceae bacterium]|nr:SGNH/GDSL hydrolase family protein [Oscillospiraceae bacterium]